ncbi:ribonuclease D [Enterovibrio norvegicus]|uniref:ribonuclease D n=1 Tax=Enterovibrio norvegicus TaxID=188144 RepID=UPI00031A3D13|nr:ribonuclease D [Enterovibrio norvegicus]OEE51554.1 ribonuclease D [Enterovibrio norvegicus]OEF60360.1 ribonuclease D [Enterovibrio norvegicus]PMH72582.1 ribonuclease D [Enterovibrio norvegicus]PMI30111.1 ribonuclease D [Enterovibrio norvegicus]TKF18507.1 ribonuclease D [Enterovibrio norvegicus]
MNFEIVTELSHLERVCQQARNVPVVMLDTEFVRTRTLYPRLGLIQMFDGETLSLIDPIELDDLSPLWAVLSDESVIKVLHACSEDLEVFHHYAGVMPTPMIDTQIMAAFLGHGLSTGFAALVDEYLGVTLDKGEARTDWCARPLSDKQLEYAAADVHYLLPLYEILAERVEQTGWGEAVKQECALMMSKRGKTPDPDKAYLDIKNAWQLRPKQLAVLQKLASWRLKEAQRRDLALNFVVKELNLWKVARFDIRSLEKMADEDFDRFELERHGKRLIAMALEADNTPETHYPEPIARLVDMPGYKQTVKSIKDQTNAVAEQLGVVPEFVGSKKQIHQMLKWAWINECNPEKMPDLLSGWRKPYLEDKVLPLLRK